MTFEELKKIGVSGETILVDVNGIGRLFIGFIHHQAVFEHSEKLGKLVAWGALEISTWTIKKPERKTIDLYHTFNHSGVSQLCDSSGNSYDFMPEEEATPGKIIVNNEATRNNNKRFKSNVVHITVYADTFEPV